MGCKSSSDEGDNKISAEFKPTQVPSVDQFFDSCKEFLEKSEDIRSKLSDSYDEMQEIGKAYYVKDPKLADLVVAWLTACMAQSHVSGKNFDFKLEEQSPYIKVDVNIFSEDVQKFYAALKAFFQGLVEAPQEVPKLLEKGQDLVKAAADMPNKLKDEGSALAMKDKLTATKNIAGNANKLKNGVAKLQTIQQSLNTLATDLKDFVSRRDALAKKAKDDGKKAFDEGKDNKNFTVSYCLDKYTESPKKTEAEIKKLEAERKKKQDSKAKKGGDHGHGHSHDKEGGHSNENKEAQKH